MKMLVSRPFQSTPCAIAIVCTTAVEPKASVTMSNGCVRRQGSVNISAAVSAVVNGRQSTASLSTPSAMATGTSRPTSTQSRQTCVGAPGARGSLPQGLEQL